MAVDDATAKHVLLLAGSGEARAIAAGLAARPGLRVTASQLHEPRVAAPLPVPTRFGGFGGAAGFERFMRDEAVAAVLDAAHPFAVRVGARAARFCAAHGLPYARVLRPAWHAEPGDTWLEVPDEAGAVAALRPGQRVFTTTGLASLDVLSGATSVRLFVRRLRGEPVPSMPPHVTFVHDTGPFTVADEVATLRALRIDLLLVKNSGGAASFTKLQAARDLGLPVILIARPAQPEGPVLSDVAATLDWVDRL
jgi:precorrin-6A/cobalt-precorrin-6A reductase